jgi:hypothetical protein
MDHDGRRLAEFANYFVHNGTSESRSEFGLSYKNKTGFGPNCGGNQVPSIPFEMLPMTEAALVSALAVLFAQLRKTDPKRTSAQFG